MTKTNNILMVKIIYHSKNRAKHSVYGSERLYGGRPFDYGFRKPGATFKVAEKDVVAMPDRFYAYPCDKPFEIKNGKAINPCTEEFTKTQVGGTLEDIPGIGPRLAERLISYGIDTPELVLKQVTDEVLSELAIPPASANKIREWQASQQP